MFQFLYHWFSKTIVNIGSYTRKCNRQSKKISEEKKMRQLGCQTLVIIYNLCSKCPIKNQTNRWLTRSLMLTANVCRKRVSLTSMILNRSTYLAHMKCLLIRGKSFQIVCSTSKIFHYQSIYGGKMYKIGEAKRMTHQTNR